MKIRDVLEAVNKIAPFESACDWDNCGLMCGDENADAARALVTLDADMYALELAAENRCSVVISHHPLIFDGIKSVTADLPIYHFIKNNIAVISAHTCLDAAKGGINDLLAELAGIKNPHELLIDGKALGRYGDADAGDTAEYIDKLKHSLPSERADCIINRPIKRAAIVSGSGGSALELLGEYGCDTLITGEAKHSHFVYAENNGLNLLTFGHFETENIITRPLARRLSGMLPDISFTVSDRTEFVKRR